MTALDQFVCEPWCSDPHGRGNLRADQRCISDERRVVLGLHPHAPSLPVTEDDLLDQPAQIAVTGQREFYRLPVVDLWIWWPSKNEHVAIDHDIPLTVAEARQLAQHLLAVADMIEATDG